MTGKVSRSVLLIVPMLLVLLMAGSSGAHAQTFFDPKKYEAPVSTLMPIIPREFLKDLPPEAPLSNDATNAVYDRCLSRVPSRFSADAHQYYCNCTAAATQGLFTTGEITTLQNADNRTIRNSTFEKYIRNVIYPCMDVPIDEIEYATCAMNRNNDWRIRYPIPYCQCVTSKVKEHFKDYGETELLVGWGTLSKKKKDPIDALWETTDFQNARSRARDECVGSYIDLEVHKRVKP